LSLADAPNLDRSKGREFRIVDPSLPAGVDPLARWGGSPMTGFDFNADGKLDLIIAKQSTEGYSVDPATGIAPEDQRDRYRKDGTWLAPIGPWSLHLFENTGGPDRFEFTYVGQIELPTPPPGGPMTPVDPTDPSAGLLILGYYGDLWRLPLLETGQKPVWGEPTELMSLQGAPFTRTCNMVSIATADLDGDGRFDVLGGDISSNVVWLRRYGQDDDGAPIFDTPRKIKQHNPQVNGGIFSVPTAGDWRDTGVDDLLVGSIEGYIFWYKTISTNPLRFSPPERVRWGDEEIRRYAKPNPAAGYHWGSSQGPLDGFNGGYSNPVLVDWNGNGLLDLIVGDMVGLFDWFPNRGTKQQPRLEHPMRLHVGDEPLFGPWRVQPGAGDFTGDGLPDIVTMDLDLDLSLYRRVGPDDMADLSPGVKLLYENGETIKTHGVYTEGGGDGRGRTKIQVLDWDGNGKLDLLVGVGPQGGSAFHSSFVLLMRNVGDNANPVYKLPEVLLFGADGEGQEFWRHGAHPTAVDWDGDGRYELVVGADMGALWYFKPSHFGTPTSPESHNVFRTAEQQKRL
jgi:hypothetical protein